MANQKQLTTFRKKPDDADFPENPEEATDTEFPENWEVESFIISEKANICYFMSGTFCKNTSSQTTEVTKGIIITKSYGNEEWEASNNRTKNSTDEEEFEITGTLQEVTNEAIKQARSINESFLEVDFFSLPDQN